MGTTHTIGIIMNGVTGRMGTNQHLKRSVAEIRGQGGVKVGDDTIMPDPVLVGRNPQKLEALAAETGVENWTTDLDSVLADDRYSVYSDFQTTDRRVAAVKQAIAAGKHIYCEKPTALNTADALELHRLAESAGVKHGVVQDKLWLPGIVKLKRLIDQRFFGRILSVRGEFGYWVFSGEDAEQPSQRPSWNYRAEDGGGIIFDMLCHWRYVLDNTFGNVRSLSCVAAVHLPDRWDENNEHYDATAEDAAYATFDIDGDILAHFNSSWCVRARRDVNHCSRCHTFTRAGAYSGLQASSQAHKLFSHAPGAAPPRARASPRRDSCRPTVPRQRRDTRRGTSPDASQGCPRVRQGVPSRVNRRL